MSSRRVRRPGPRTRSVLRRNGDRVYGRGTTDMKGFVAAALAAVPGLCAAPLTRPIYLALTHDEEVGCLGAPALIEALPTGQDVIVGEPTGLKIAARHSGARLQTLHVVGVPAHSGRPLEGVNAVAHAAGAVTALTALGTRYVDCGAKKGRVPPSLVVTKIEGGSAPNIVPGSCRVTWMFRPTTCALSDQMAAEIQDIADRTDRDLKAAHPDAFAELTTHCDVPAFATEATDSAARLCRNLADPGDPISVEFATEAGLYQRAGHSVVVCGPGNMAQGHIDDEFIDLAQLDAAGRFLDGVVVRACA